MNSAPPFATGFGAFGQPSHRPSEAEGPPKKAAFGGSGFGAPCCPPPADPGTAKSPWPFRTSPANSTQPHTNTDPSLPTDVAGLHSMINTLKAELKATSSVNTHLAASVARLQAEQVPPTPTTTTPATTTDPTTATTTPSKHSATDTAVPCSHPEHPRTIASGRGAASPEVFKQLIKNNWHGRLGRTHMADVDGLSATALTELDCYLRRKLHAILPRGGAYADLDADKIFASLAVLGLRLEDRGAYADLVVLGDNTLHDAATIQRGKNWALFYYQSQTGGYWKGSVLETLIELARYRGLFDDDGFLKKE